MQIYSDEEILNLTKQVALTPEAFALIEKKKAELKKNGRKVSLAKIVCNLIVEHL